MYSENDWRYYSADHLEHHGIMGQKWGIRRYQNPDGTLTDAGKKRYGYSNSDPKSAKEYKKKLNTLNSHRADQITAMMNYSAERNKLNNKINRAKFDNNTKALNKLLSTSDIVNKKISAIEAEYSNTTKIFNDTLEKLKNDDRYVYKTKENQYGETLLVGADSRYAKDLHRELRNDYGKSGRGSDILGNSAYTYTKRTAYDVADATDRRRRSKKWNTRHNDYGFTPTTVRYHY